MTEVKNNRQRAQFAIISFWILIVFKILSNLIVYLYYRQITRSAYYNSPVLSPYFEYTSIIGSVALIVQITAIISFILWFYRAYVNLERLEVKLKYASSWAILGWILPLANLFIPFQIMQEISKKTQKAAKGVHLDNSAMIFLWWILFVGLTIYQYASVLSFNANNYIILYSAVTLGNIISLLMVIKLIKEINVYEMILFSRGGDGFEELDHLVE